MKLLKLIGVSAVLLLGAAGLPSRAAEPSAVGLWEQVDATTRKPESWFRISEKNGTYESILVKSFSSLARIRTSSVTNAKATRRVGCWASP
jgi:hypothetical protein